MDEEQGSVQEAPAPKELKISELVEALQTGITRLKGDPGYTPERGSIEEKYNLTKTEVKTIFKHKKLLGLKFRAFKTVSYIIVDDVEGQPETVPGYGDKTASAISREVAATTTPTTPTEETTTGTTVTATSTTTSTTEETLAQEETEVATESHTF